MKKILPLLSIMVLLLTGCQGSEPKITVCEGISNGVNVVNTIKYEGKKVNSIIYENSITVDETLIDTVKDAAQTYEASVQGVKGLTYSYKIEGNMLTETTTIDYDLADMEQLASMGMIDASEEGKINFVDYELTINNMTSMNLTCTEQ